MDLIASIRLGLWIANGLIYGYALRLYLRPDRTEQRPVCPLCGTHTDAFCVGVAPLDLSGGSLPIRVLPIKVPAALAARRAISDAWS